MEQLQDDMTYEVADFEQDPQPKLKDSDRKRLDSIVMRMHEGGASGDEIKAVVDDFKSKYLTKPLVQKPAQQVQPGREMAGVFGGQKPSDIVKPVTVTPSVDMPKPTREMIQRSNVLGKAKKAQELLVKELASNDDVVEKHIRRSRIEEEAARIGVPISDMPPTPSSMNAQLMLPPELRAHEQPVAPEELAAARADIEQDETKARYLLGAVGNVKPDKKREIEKSVYVIDAVRHAEKDPNGASRMERINKNAEEIDNGKLIYDVNNGRLIKPEGVAASLVTGWKGKSKLFDDYSFFNNKSDEEVIGELEKRRTEYDPDEPIPVPKHKLSELSQMVGGMPIKALVAGGVTGAIPGLQKAAPFVAGAVGAQDFYRMGYAGTLQNVYYQMRDEGKSETEALEIARGQAKKEASIDAAMGAAMTFVGTRFGMKPLNFSPGYRSAVTTFLKGAGKEGALQGVIGAGGEIAKNVLAQHAGIKRETDAHVLEAIEGNFLLTVGMAAAARAGRGLSSAKYRSLLNGLKKVDEGVLETNIQSEVDAGRITEEQASTIRNEVSAYKKLDGVIPENVTEEARIEIQNKIEKRDKLKQQLETQHESFHPAIKEKIKAIDEEINTLAHQKEPKEKISDDVKTAKKIIQDAVDDGVMNDVYAGMAKQDPEGFMKFVADQSFGRTDDGTIHEAGGAEGAMREQFGDAVVDHAKEMFPLEERADEFESLRHSIAISNEVPEITASETRGGKFNPEVRVGNLHHQWAKGFDTKEQAIEWMQKKLEATTPIEDKKSSVSVIMPEDVKKPDVVEVKSAENVAEPPAGDAGLPPVEVGGAKIHVERPGVELSHSGLQDVANEFSLPDVQSRERVSDVQLRTDAEIQAKEWADKGEYASNIERLTKEAESGKVLTDKERVIMEQHLANLIGDARAIADKTSPEYAAKFAEISRLKRAGEKTRSAAGAALRISGDRSIPTDSPEDMIVAKEEAVGRPTTPEEKQKANEQFEKIDKAKKSLSAKGKEIADRIRSLRPKTDSAQSQFFGLAVGIYDTALVTIAEAVEQGAKLADAIQRGLEYVKANGGFKNKNEERNFIGYMKGTIEYDERLASFKARTKTATEKLKQKTNVPYAQAGQLEPEPKAIFELDAEAQQLKREYRKAKAEFELELQKDKLRNRSKMQKFIDVILEIPRSSRSILTSIDLSGVLRQGIVPTIAHPLKAAKAFPEMIAQAFSKGRFDDWLADLKETPAYEIMDKSGLYIADPNSLHLSAKEEQFMSNFAERIPILGALVKGSERAYVSYLNKMRADIFKQGMDVFMRNGKTPENSPQLYEGLANWINNATGRGKLGPLEGSAELMNTGFFSPRLMASRINTLGLTDIFTAGQKGFYSQLPREVRVMALKDMAKFIGFGLTVLGVSKLAGAEVEDDPRSTDFGKMKIGNTRYDIWGGYQQYIRLLSQLFTFKSKSGDGSIKDLSGKEWFGKIGSFVRSKLAPLPSSAVDVIMGENVVGEPATLQSEAIESVIPMIYRDVQEAVKDKGVSAIFSVGVPALLGVSVNTYESGGSKKNDNKRSGREKPKREKRETRK